MARRPRKPLDANWLHADRPVVLGVLTRDLARDKIPFNVKEPEIQDSRRRCESGLVPLFFVGEGLGFVIPGAFKGKPGHEIMKPGTKRDLP